MAKHGLRGGIKISYILGLQRERTGERERREGEKKKKRKRKRRRREAKIKKVWIHDFCMEIMASSMILVQELVGYGLLGFHLDINLVPFSRFLLGIHPNTRFKGSLVENP